MAIKNPKSYICEKCGKSFLSKWKKKYCSTECFCKDISNIWRNKELVIKLYCEKKMSYRSIGKIIGAKDEHIRRKLHKWGIDVRTIGQALKGRKQTPLEIKNRVEGTRNGKGFNFLNANKANIRIRTGKTYKEIYGIEKAKKIKENISLNNIGKIGKKQTPEQKLNHSNKMKGKFSGNKNYFWKGGIYKSKYPSVFNGQLKLKIRIRDKFTCQECRIKEEDYKRKLDIHHIDYDKKNNKEDNLISLCKKCHGKTQFKKKDWIHYYKLKIGEKR